MPAVKAVSGSHALATDGTAWSWGVDNNGELGNGTHSSTPQAVPVQVSGLTGVVALGFDFDGAITSDGTAWAWGDNLAGELGNGTIGGESDVPVKISGATGVGALAGFGGGGYELVPGSPA
jgi:alpha-tubulin suppressor-like RCC1 family protein